MELLIVVLAVTQIVTSRMVSSLEKRLRDCEENCRYLGYLCQGVDCRQRFEGGAE